MEAFILTHFRSPGDDFSKFKGRGGFDDEELDFTPQNGYDDYMDEDEDDAVER